MIKKIAVTGPESTGKSLLSMKLAQHYNTVWVPEYARGYINSLGRPYGAEDILKIAQGQLRSEANYLPEARKLLVCDTELIVTKIWYEHKYKTCPPWILDQIEKHTYDLYLLMNIDVDWEEDAQREHPHLRKYFFHLFLSELQSRELNFKVISGLGEQRLKHAIQDVDLLMHNSF